MTGTNASDAAGRQSGANDQPADHGATPSATEPPEHMKPGDEAPEGADGTGEDVCPRCGGSGRLDGSPCAACEGTGVVTVGIGGA